MKAIARRSDPGSYRHHVTVGDHEIETDEPRQNGGEDTGPSPQELLAASLAGCTATTMEMYAKRKGWDIGNVGVAVEYTPADRGCPTRFQLELELPSDCTDEQRERLQVIAAKCPIHRALEGEVMFDEHVKLVEPSGDEPAPAPKRGATWRLRPLSRT